MIDEDKKEDLLEYYVAKSNSIIRARYTLTLEQNKALIFIISKIKYDDDFTQWYSFSFKELCSVLNLNITDGGTYYGLLKKDLEELTKRHLVKFPDGSYKTISFLGDVDCEPKSDIIKVCFNQNMAPYLFQLRKNYTQYHLYEALVYKSVYSLRLFEVLRSYTVIDKLKDMENVYVSFDLEELKELLNVKDKYERWIDFKNYVLDKSLDEINRSSRYLNILYSTAREGRKIKTITFNIGKADIPQMVSALGEYHKYAEKNPNTKKRKVKAKDK